MSALLAELTSSSTHASCGHIFRISTEVMDVLLYPSQSHTLVTKTIICLVSCIA